MPRPPRVTACQIPEDEILQMSTKDLLQHILNYPFMIGIFAFSSFLVVFGHIRNEFNVFSELVERKGYGDVLIGSYSRPPSRNKLIDT